MVKDGAFDQLGAHILPTIKFALNSLVPSFQKIRSQKNLSQQWQEAEHKHRIIMQDRCRVLGHEHPDTLQSMDDLANVLYNQWKLHEAEEMHREVLEVRCRVLGQEHKSTVASMNNLANVLRNQEKWQEAEMMQREALQLQRKVLGQEHEGTLISMSNLALVLEDQGKWQEAEMMHREALELQRRVLGHRHQDTLNSIISLANVLRNQGKWREAEEMLREVLELQCRVLGHRHQDTLNSINSLATVLRNQGKWREAEEMLREVLEVRRRVIGQEHPDTLDSMNDLALVLEEQGKWQEAETVHRESLELHCRVHGERLQDILSSMSNLASVLDDQGKWQKAEEMLREVLEVRRRVLGHNHVLTARSMCDIAQFLVTRDRDDCEFRFRHLDKATHQQRFNTAVTFLRCGIEVLQKAIVAKDHPDLLSYRADLAELLVQANELSLLHEAEDLLQLIIPGLFDRFGMEHPRTQRAMANLVFLLEEQGKDAEQWRQRLAHIEDAVDSTTALTEGFEQGTFEVQHDIASSSFLKDLLGKQQPLCNGDVWKAASSSLTASEAAKVAQFGASAVLADATELSADLSDGSCAQYNLEWLESVDASSRSSLAWLEAAHQEMLQHRQREGHAET